MCGAFEGCGFSSGPQRFLPLSRRVDGHEAGSESAGVCSSAHWRHCSFPGVRLSWANSRWPLGRSWLLLAGKYRGPPGTLHTTIVVPSLGCWEVMLWSRPRSPRNKTIRVPTTSGGQCVWGPPFWAGRSGREKEEQFAWGSEGA